MSQGLIRIMGPFPISNVNRWAEREPTILFMPFFDLEGELPSLNDIIPCLHPSCQSRQLRARKACDGAEMESIDDQRKNVA